jgi:hypothetical protein
MGLLPSTPGKVLLPLLTVPLAVLPRAETPIVFAIAPFCRTAQRLSRGVARPHRCSLDTTPLRFDPRRRSCEAPIDESHGIPRRVLDSFEVHEAADEVGPE